MASVTVSPDTKEASARGTLAALLDTRLSGICLILVLLALWEASARFGIVESMNWPPFSAVMVALYRNLITGELVTVIGSTLWVMLRGYVVGVAYITLFALVIVGLLMVAVLVR